MIIFSSLFSAAVSIAQWENSNKLVILIVMSLASLKKLWYYIMQCSLLSLPTNHDRSVEKRSYFKK